MGSIARGSRITDADLSDQQKRFDQSGKTAIAFCEGEGIPVSTFYQRRARWKKLAREGRAAATKRPAKFVDAGTAVMVPPHGLATGHALSQRDPLDRVELRIDLGGGVVLHVTRS